MKNAKKFHKASNSNGFTLIELLLVVGILLILMATISPVYSNFTVSTQLNEFTSQTTQLLRTAREKSVAGFNDSAQGVFFEINSPGDDRVILFQGDSYSGRDPSHDYKIVLDSALSISTTLSGGEVVFSKGLGKPSSTGTIVLTHGASGSRTISVNDLGLVEEI